MFTKPYFTQYVFSFAAIVTLKDGNQLENAVKELNGSKLKDNEVTVSFCPNERLLCVAHLPPRYSDDEFRKLVSQHGPVKFCFLMRSETTGKSNNNSFNCIAP